MDIGDWIFEAVLTLGWTVVVAESGAIRAEPERSEADSTVLYGIIHENGTITWEGLPASEWIIVKRARICALRKRVAHAKRARLASHAPLSGRARSGC